MKRVVSVLLLGIFSVTSCRHPQTLGPTDYIRYVENVENGYRKTIETRSLKYTIQLGTSEFMAIKEARGGNGELDLHALETRLKELHGYTFFILKMARKNQTGSTDGTYMATPSEAESMVMYYEQEASKDLHLKVNDHLESPAVYHFENNYGLSPENTIVAGFNVPCDKDLELIFNDRYANEPLVKCVFSKESLSQLPNLKIN